jgi:hypothetical protein
MAGKGRPGPAKGTTVKPPNSGGSRKGRPNRVTAKAREVIQLVLDGTAPKVQGWIDKIAETDPKGALLAYTALLEFGVPKLARTELTGKDGGEIETKTTIVINGVPAK